jgi:hypothetical protein
VLYRGLRNKKFLPLPQPIIEKGKIKNNTPSVPKKVGEFYF